jgi:predicted lipid-binding transport protein (Tim44 family)
VNRLARTTPLGILLGILDVLGRAFPAFAWSEAFGSQPTFGGCVNSSLLGGDSHFVGPTILDVLLAAAVVYLGYRFLRSRRSSDKDKKQPPHLPTSQRRRPSDAPPAPTDVEPPPDADQSARGPASEKPQGRRPANRFEAAQQMWDWLGSGDAQQAPRPPQSGGMDQDDLLRGAKVVYVRIRAAMEKNNLEEVRDFATPEALEQMRKIAAGLPQTAPSHILLVNARILKITELGSGFRVRVELSALIRESEDDKESREIKEVWRFVRRDSKDNWRLEAIEQGDGPFVPAEGEVGR